MSFETFKRTAKLSREVEDQLQSQLSKLIPQGISAKQIARELHFGEPGMYAILKVPDVWAYRGKFNDPELMEKRGYKPFGKFPGKRGRKKGCSHYNDKREKTMSLTEFKDRLNSSTTPPGKTGYNKDYNRRKRAYLILQYWSVLRKSELYERKRKDFTIEGDLLKIMLLRKKKFHKLKEYRVDAPQEPFYIPLTDAKEMMMNEVVSWIDSWGAEERPFDFDGGTAWNYTREVFPGLYPHFFRADWISKTIAKTNDTEGLISKLLKDTRMDIRTIINYILQDPKNKAALGREMAKLEIKT